MMRSANLVGAAALSAAIGLSSIANAETARGSAIRSAPVGRQIIVHPREPYLTAGTGATVGSLNRYLWDTFRPPYRNSVQGTFVGMRGEDRLPNRFTVPGSDEPLFTF